MSTTPQHIKEPHDPLKPSKSSLPPAATEGTLDPSAQENDALAAYRPPSPRKEPSDGPRVPAHEPSDTSPASGRSSPIRAPAAKPMRSPSPTRMQQQQQQQHSVPISPVVSSVKHALDLEPEADPDLEDTVKRPNILRSVSAPLTQVQHAHVPQAVPSHLIKTSKTHPLHVSPLLPPEALYQYHQSIFGSAHTPPLTVSRESTASDALSVAVRQPIWFLQHAGIPLPPSTRPPPSLTPTSSPSSPQRIGNFLLSSCPGKKVRLTIPYPPQQNHRSAISRDVYLDLHRISTHPDYNARAVICCLDDNELAMLGAPWPEYSAAAAKLGLAVFRLPLQEGFAPDSVDILDDLLQDVITKYTLQGHNVLCHCRGGVGRAGLVGVAWWLKMGLAGNLQAMAPSTAVERCIRWIRQRRRCVFKYERLNQGLLMLCSLSTKAIETPVQVLYLHSFIAHLAQHGQLVKAASLLPSSPV